MKKILFLLVILTIISVAIFFIKDSKKESVLLLELKGKKIITININEKFFDPGFKAFDTIDGDLTNKVKIINNINTSKEGNYQITYKVKNSKGISKEAYRFVKVKSLPYYKEEYNNLDNTTRSWWATNKKNKTRPTGGADINELKKYNAYYLGPDEKIIYLTFDEGALETYIKEIVEVLDKNNAKATFFLCYKYMIENKELIKNMVSSGHTIGNHTVNHLNMPSLATKEKFNEYLYEIQKVEQGYKEITGKNMEKIYRSPRGEWSIRDLQIMKDLGYKTYFYSAYYLDFENDVSKEYALNELLIRYHNGAIYLLHPKNKGNLEALDSFIKIMKNNGYKFDLVKNIP